MDGDVAVTDGILRCAIAVHRHFGPGLFESTYERALYLELVANGMRCDRQVLVPIHYRGELIARYRIDLIVEEQVIVEVKAVERLAPIHMAQILSYLRIKSLKVGLLLNFNSPTIQAGTRRVVLNA